MFGLRVTAPHDGYVGHRAIFNGRHIDILPNRASAHGSSDSIGNVVSWANKKRAIPVPGKKRPRKISPWEQMMLDAPKVLSTRDDTDWEIKEGNFVLRCNPQASYGYLYIALFELTPEEALVPATV